MTDAEGKHNLNDLATVPQRAWIFTTSPEDTKSGKSSEIFVLKTFGSVADYYGTGSIRPSTNFQPAMSTDSTSSSTLLQPGQLLCRTEYVVVAPLAQLHLEGVDSGAEKLGLPLTKKGDASDGESVLRIMAIGGDPEAVPAIKDYKVDDLIFQGGKVSEWKVIWADGRDNPHGTRPPVKVPTGVPPETYLAAMTVSAGMTAWLGVEKTGMGAYVEQLKELHQEGRQGPRGKEPVQPVVAITSAAGAVGLILGQLFKLKGAIVIGITSEPPKAKRLVDEFGFSYGIAYNGWKPEFQNMSGDSDPTTPARVLAEQDESLLSHEDRALSRTGRYIKRELQNIHKQIQSDQPNGNHFDQFLVDVLVDNVGSEQLDVVTSFMRAGGKILGVGTISERSGFADHTKLVGFKQYSTLIGRNLEFKGFMVTAYLMHIPEAVGALAKLLARRQLNPGVTLVEDKFEVWPDLLDRVLAGGQSVFGRLVLKLSKLKLSKL